MLAIAAARALRSRVVASDIDTRAVAVARANARANAVGPLVEVVHAGGLTARRLRERGPYDLVLANILLAPLKRLAAPIARMLAPNARVILSGLLVPQAPAAIAAYRAQGLALAARIPLDEWITSWCSEHDPEKPAPCLKRGGYRFRRLREALAPLITWIGASAGEGQVGKDHARTMS